MDKSTRYQLFVASFGIVPFYCAPYLMSEAVAAAITTPELSSAIPSTMMAAQLVFLLLYPVFEDRVTSLVKVKNILFCASVILLLCSLLNVSFYILIFSCGVIGVASAALFFFGTSISLSAVNSYSAFALRLSFTLILTGVVSLFFVILSTELSVRAFLIAFGLFYFILFLIFPSEKASGEFLFDLDIEKLSFKSFLPILAVFVFFLGQTGFYSYHVVIFSDQNLYTYLALSSARIAAGLFLIFLGAWFATRLNAGMLLILGLGEVVAVYLLIDTSGYLAIFALIVGYEIMLNLVAASAQASAGALSPILAKKFLPIAIISGAVVGPLLFGLLLVEFSDIVALPLICLSIFVMLALYYFKKRTQ